MGDAFPVHLAREIVLGALKAKPRGQFLELLGQVAVVAAQRGVYQVDPRGYGSDPRVLFRGTDREVVPELVRQEMWQLLARGVLVFGIDEANPAWPFYTLTPRGRSAVQEQLPQPYDPDGFLKELVRVVPKVDPVVLDYVSEAVRAFNHACPKAAAVMLGAASEKLVLVLHDTFGRAIHDATKVTGVSVM